MWPAIGQHAAHTSTATPVPGDPVKECGWDSTWIPEGAGEPKPGRWLCGYRGTGGDDDLQKTYYRADLTWKTQLPLAVCADKGQLWMSMPRRRGWVDKRGRWIGPQHGRVQYDKRTQSHSPAPLSAKQKRLRDDPDGVNEGPPGGRNLITRLAEQPTTDTEEYD